jgi:hypothetical protein
MGPGVGHFCLGQSRRYGVGSANGQHLLPVSEEGVSATSTFHGQFFSVHFNGAFIRWIYFLDMMDRATRLMWLTPYGP